MWEYKRDDISYSNIVELNEKLKLLGENGWEIIYYEEVPKDSYSVKNQVKFLAKKLKIGKYPAG